MGRDLDEHDIEEVAVRNSFIQTQQEQQQTKIDIGKPAIEYGATLNVPTTKMTTINANRDK
jgi:hypothetical protein